MTNKEIIEGNKLIAEWFGYVTDGNENPRFYVEDHLECIVNGIDYWETTDEEWSSWLYPKQMKFHSSWDWLMPVIDKIESLEGSNPFKDNPKVKLQGDHIEIFWYATFRGKCIFWKDYMGIDGNSYSHLAQEESRILAVFKAIIEFINWYNEHNNLN